MFIHCHDPRKNTTILAGEYNPVDYTFIKKVRPEHYMVKEHGYGIQEEVLQELKIMGCINILIISKDKEYISLLEDWLKLSVQNYGSGRQRFLKVIRKDK
jgi:hypothetical protein